MAFLENKGVKYSFDTSCPVIVASKTPFTMQSIGAYAPSFAVGI